MIYFHHSSYNSHKLCPNPIFSYKRRVSYINNKIITTFACYIKKEPYEQKIYYTMYPSMHGCLYCATDKQVAYLQQIRSYRAA